MAGWDDILDEIKKKPIKKRGGLKYVTSIYGDCQN